MIRTTLVVALSLAIVSACKKKEGDASGGAATGDKTAEPAAAPAKLKYQKLGSLPLEAEVPEGANIDDTSKGAGFPSVTIYADPTTFVSGAGDMSDLKPTIEDTKTRLGKDPNKLKTFTREEKTADGWILELTREAMIEPGKELYGVSVRKTINGAPFDCGTNGKSKEEQQKAEKLCMSLRAAK